MPRPIEFVTPDITKVDYAGGDSGLLYATELSEMYNLVSLPIEVAGLSIYTAGTYIKTVSNLMENYTYNAIKVGDNYIVSSQTKELSHDFSIWINFNETNMGEMSLTINGVSRVIRDYLGNIPIDNDIVASKPTLVKYDLDNDYFIILDTNNKNSVSIDPLEEIKLEEDTARFGNDGSHTFVLPNKRLETTVTGNSNSLMNYFEIDLDLVNSNSSLHSTSNYSVFIDFSFSFRPDISDGMLIPTDESVGDFINGFGKIKIDRESSTGGDNLYVSYKIDHNNKKAKYGIGAKKYVNANKTKSYVRIYIIDRLGSSNHYKFDNLLVNIDKIHVEDMIQTMSKPTANELYNSISITRKLSIDTDTESPTFLDSLVGYGISEQVYYGNDDIIKVTSKDLHRHSLKADKAGSVMGQERLTMTHSKVYLKGTTPTGFSVTELEATKGNIGIANGVIGTDLPINILPSEYDRYKNKSVGVDSYIPVQYSDSTISSMYDELVSLEDYYNTNNDIEEGDKYPKFGSITATHKSKYSTNANAVLTKKYLMLNEPQKIILPQPSGKDYTFNEGDEYFYVDSDFDSNVNATNSKTRVVHDGHNTGYPYLHNNKETFAGQSAYIANVSTDNDLFSFSFSTYTYLPYLSVRSLRYPSNVESTNFDWVSLTSRMKMGSNDNNNFVKLVEDYDNKKSSLSFNISINSTSSTKERYNISDEYEIDKFKAFIDVTKENHKDGIVMRVNSKPVTSHQYNTGTTNDLGIGGYGINNYNRNDTKGFTKVYQPLYKTKTHKFTFPLSESISTCIFVDLEDGLPYMYGDDMAHKCDVSGANQNYTMGDLNIHEDPVECFTTYTGAGNDILDASSIHLFEQSTSIGKNYKDYYYTGNALNRPLYDVDHVINSHRGIKTNYLSPLKPGTEDKILRKIIFEYGSINYFEYNSVIRLMDECMDGSVNFPAYGDYGLFNGVDSNNTLIHEIEDSIKLEAIESLTSSKHAVKNPLNANDVVRDGRGTTLVFHNATKFKTAYHSSSSYGFVKDVDFDSLEYVDHTASNVEQYKTVRNGTEYIKYNIGNPNDVIGSTERTSKEHAEEVSSSSRNEMKNKIHILERLPKNAFIDENDYHDIYIETETEMFYGSYYIEPFTTPNDRTANATIKIDASSFDVTNPYLSKVVSANNLKKISNEIFGPRADEHYITVS